MEFVPIPLLLPHIPFFYLFYSFVKLKLLLPPSLCNWCAFMGVECAAQLYVYVCICERALIETSLLEMNFFIYSRWYDFSLFFRFAQMPFWTINSIFILCQGTAKFKLRSTYTFSETLRNWNENVNSTHDQMNLGQWLNNRLMFQK